MQGSGAYIKLVVCVIVVADVVVFLLVIIVRVARMLDLLHRLKIVKVVLFMFELSILAFINQILIVDWILFLV